MYDSVIEESTDEVKLHAYVEKGVTSEDGEVDAPEDVACCPRSGAMYICSLEWKVVWRMRKNRR